MQACDYDNFDFIFDLAAKKARSQWEIDFIDDLQEKLDAYGDETFISARQWLYIQRIAQH